MIDEKLLPDLFVKTLNNKDKWMESIKPIMSRAEKIRAEIASLDEAIGNANKTISDLYARKQSAVGAIDVLLSLYSETMSDEMVKEVQSWK